MGGEVNPEILDDFRIKRDKYRKKRGGRSDIYQIDCAGCEKTVLVYQKDGLGALLRLYLDRILWPPNLAQLSDEVDSVKDFQSLRCPHCDGMIGVPMIYQRENRPAFRLIRGSIKKKKIKPR